MYNTGLSLKNQARLLAATAAATDCTMLVLNGLAEIDPLLSALLLAAITGTGLSLALPPRYAGVVWVANSLVQVLATYALSYHSYRLPIATATFLVAGYLVGAWSPTRYALIALAMVISAFVAGDVGVGFVGWPTNIRSWALWALGLLASSTLPLFVGRYNSARNAYVAELKHRADRRRLVEDAALTKAMVEERAAIARDLHDVISHHVSATGVQAGAARRALERGFTEAVKTSIQSIEHANRVASAELHRQLDLLHGAAIDGQRKPSIANLDQVIEIVRRSGVEVDARVVHLPVNLEQSVDITVYRICQELLTNALKHGSGRVYLSIVATETRICIEQTNILSQSSDQFVPGRGLTGIFQRVCLFGGVFHYGHNRATSTWWAKASIPIGDV